MLNALQLVYGSVCFLYLEIFELANPFIKSVKKITSSWGKLRLPVFQCTWKIHYWFNADSNMWETHNQSTVTFPHVCSLPWKFLSPFYFYWNLRFSSEFRSTAASKVSSNPLPHSSITKSGSGKVLFAPNCSLQDILFISLPIIHSHFQLMTTFSISLRR